MESFVDPQNKCLLTASDWKSSGVVSKFGLIYVLTTPEHGVTRNPNKMLAKIMTREDNLLKSTEEGG
jgi:hypothetical protein